MSESMFDKVFYALARWFAWLVLAIPITLAYLGINVLLLIKKLKLHCVTDEAVHLSHFHGGKMFELDCLSTKEKKDFVKHRSSTYIQQMTYGSLWELSKFIGNKQRVPLIEDHVMRDVILKSVFSHGLIRGDDGSNIKWRLPFHLNHYRVFDGFYWDVREIRLHRNRSMSIVDRLGRIHTPTSPSWRLAKAHAQAQLTFFAPGLAHNHVHFVFPSLMAAHVRSVLPPTSILRQLLEPHTRFTQYINYQALNVCQSSSNTGSMTDRIFRPWLSFPINNDDFLAGIQENCEKFYYDNFTLIQELHDELPYHAFLKQYFVVVKEYVTKLEPLLKEDYETLSSSVSEYLPVIQSHSLNDVITTLIWNCAVVHFCDHQSYLTLFANKYGCMSMRHPLVSNLIEKGNVDGDKLPTTDDAVCCNLFSSEDIYRTRCFLKTFVRFNHSSTIDVTLPKTRYGFDSKLAQKASDEFLQKLQQLDANLRHKGKSIVPLSEIVRTVCF